MMGLGQRVQVDCPACSGTGYEAAKNSKKCPSCSGARNLTEMARVPCFIRPGTRDGDTVTLTGEGPFKPGEEPGDVVVTVKHKSHPSFQCKGDDLLGKISVS